jgi:hypothetical protein
MMLILSMASFCCNPKPAIRFYQFDNIPNFHPKIKNTIFAKKVKRDIQMNSSGSTKRKSTVVTENLTKESLLLILGGGLLNDTAKRH